MPRDRENGGKRTIGPINKSVIGGPRVYPEWLDWLLKVISREGKRVWVRKALSRSSSLFLLPRSTIGISCRRTLPLPVLSPTIFLHLPLCFTVSVICHRFVVTGWIRAREKWRQEEPVINFSPLRFASLGLNDVRVWIKYLFTKDRICVTANVESAKYMS